ncbi:MAG: hypothetical protein M3017_05650 [Actinomycetota bacterium]|nr:hypothetical protein [Actinomycetota bacterium]
MNVLPAAYELYLVGKDEDAVATIRPVLLQSAADQLHGVRVVTGPKELQAHLDDRIPYGEVVEDID